MITRRDTDSRTARVRVRLHTPHPEQARVAATAAGLDGDALLLMWLRARWSSRRRG